MRLKRILVCSRNSAVTSMAVTSMAVTSTVQSAVSLHGHVMHIGTAAGTVVALALRDDIQPRAIAMSPD